MSSSTTDQTRAVVTGLYAAFEAGDVAAAFGLVDPEITITYPDAMPMAGTWQGMEGLAALFEQVNALWRDRVTVVHAIVADGDRAVVLLTTSGNVNGCWIDMPIAETYRVHGGRVIEGKPFFWDTKAVAAATAAKKTG